MGVWQREPKPQVCALCHRAGARPWSSTSLVQHSPSPCPISVSGVLAVLGLVGSCPSCSNQCRWLWGKSAKVALRSMR